MRKDCGITASNTDMLVLSLINEKDMYGYQIIEELASRSNSMFEMKTGTLYPLLHLLEQKKYLVSYDSESATGKVRKYYSITEDGRKYLTQKACEWKRYTSAVNNVMSFRLLTST